MRKHIAPAIILIAYLTICTFSQNTTNNQDNQQNVRIYEVFNQNGLKTSSPKLTELSIQTDFKVYIQTNDMFKQLFNQKYYSNSPRLNNIQSVKISLENYPSFLSTQQNTQNQSSQTLNKQCIVQAPQINFNRISNQSIDIKGKPRVIVNYNDILNQQVLVDVFFYNETFFLMATTSKIFLVQIQPQVNKKTEIFINAIQNVNMHVVDAYELKNISNSLTNAYFVKCNKKRQKQSNQELVYFFSNNVNFQVKIKTENTGQLKIQLNQSSLPLARYDLLDVIVSSSQNNIIFSVLTQYLVLIYRQNLATNLFEVIQQIDVQKMFIIDSDNKSTNVDNTKSSSSLVAFQYVQQNQELILLDQNKGLFFVFLQQAAKNFHIPLKQCSDMALTQIQTSTSTSISKQQKQENSKQTIFVSCQNYLTKIQINSNDFTYTIQKLVKAPFYITQIQTLTYNKILLKSNDNFHIFYENNILGLNDDIDIKNPFIFVKKNQNYLVWIDENMLKLEWFQVKNQKIACRFNKEQDKMLYAQIVADCNQELLNKTILDHGQNISDILQDYNYCRYKLKIHMKIWQKVQLQEWLIPVLSVIVSIFLMSGVIWLIQKRRINFFKNNKEFGIEFEDQA